jgi:hypothetical protein
MAHDSRLALRRARRTGVLVCIVTVLLAAGFLAGLARQSYWALAVPVAAGVLGALTLAFWIGYTINTVRGIPAEADHYEGRAARRIALGICVASLALAAAFLLGVARGSYWALALPVGGAVLGLLAMVFWIGWAIVTQRRSLPGQPAEAPSAGAGAAAGDEAAGEGPPGAAVPAEPQPTPPPDARP